MSSSLEDLFGQILHSEQKAHERRTLINQVKNEVARTHEKITEVQEELTLLRRKLVLKLQQWNDAQLQLKSSCLHQTILRAQKEELFQAHYTLQKQVVDISRNIDIARQTFCKDVQDFTTAYDLCSSGTHQRELQAKDELRKLCAEEQSLNADLSSYKERQTELKALSRGKEKYLAQLQETREKLAGAQECVKREERLCSELEQEKIRLTELPYTDPEYKRLQADLEASRNDDLETLCSSLQQQRKELQQQLWQQELAKKRKQQQRDQSSYKQWQHLGQDQETSSQVDLSQPEPVKRQTRPNIGRITQAIRSSKTRKLSGSNQSQS